jgi:Protein of unknown function (DUF2934)
MPKAEKKQSQQDSSETEFNQMDQPAVQSMDDQTDQSSQPIGDQMDRPAAQPTDEEIAVRAYHIYLERGETGGNPDDDWLQAKRELSEGRE